MTKLMVESDELDDFDKNKYHTISEYENELQSINPEYKGVTLTDEEFSDMYELGYTLGTSSSGAFATARRSDYNQYKSGKDVNGDPIRRYKAGAIIRVHKK